MSDSTTSIPRKQCTVCVQWFPNTVEFFYSHGKNKLRSRCRECHLAIKRGHLVAIDPFRCPSGYRRCTVCREAKPETREFFAWRRRDGFDANCKVCKNKKRNDYHALHPEKQRARSKRFSDTHREHERERSQKYRETYPEKDRASKKAYAQNHPEKGLVWRENNRHILKAISQRRRAREKQLPNTFTAQDYNRMMEYWGYSCAISGETERLQIDHWIALTDPNCPGTVPGNMIPLQAKLNNSKHNKPAEHWLKSRYGELLAKNILDRVNAYFEWVKQYAG